MTKPAITTRTAKGTPLTIAEMDSNLTNLKDGNVKVAVPGTRTQFYPSGMYQTTDVQKKFGDRSLSFNGTMNYFQLYNMGGMGGINPFDLGMNSFTAEQFIYINSSGTGEQCIFDTRQTGNNGIYCYIDSSRYIRVKRGSTEIAASSAPVSADAWHHVAIERFTYGGGTYSEGLYILIDGAVGGTGAMTSMEMFDSSSQISYGRDSNYSNFFNGYMDEIRWSKNSNRYMPSMPMGTLQPAPTAELSSDYQTSYLFHCNEVGSLVDDYYSTMTLDLNDTLRFQASNGISLSADAPNKQLTISYSNTNSPAGLVVKANNLTSGTYGGNSYSGVISFSGSVAQYGSGIYTQGMGEFQISNMSSSGSFQYLIEVYGNATFTGLTGSPNLQLYNTTQNYTQTSEQINGGAMPILIASVNINSNQSNNFIVKIEGASGTETMSGTGSVILKITKLIT